MEDSKFGILFIIGIFIIFGVFGCATSGGCNYSGYDFVDNNYHFDYAYISMPDGSVIEGEVQSWSDAEDGEQLTVTLTNGDRYLCSSYNCVLVEHN